VVILINNGLAGLDRISSR